MISVVVPIYNKELSLQRCLDSIENQTVIPDEVILVNDGSTDRSLDVIKNYISCVRKNNFTLINQKNAGVSNARNKGVSISKNELIAFLDADDEWYEDFIKSMLFIASEVDDFSLATCKHKICTSHSFCFIPKQDFGKNSYGVIDNYFTRAIKYPLVNSSKVLINKKYFEKVGGFPENATLSEDLFLWIRLAELAQFAYVDNLLVCIHQEEDNSRHARINKVPYPIEFYLSVDQKNIKPSLMNYLWSIHFKHVLGSCVSSKKEAFIRMRSGVRLFSGFKPYFLFLFLFVPKLIFYYLKYLRRYLKK